MDKERQGDTTRAALQSGHKSWPLYSGSMLQTEIQEIMPGKREPGRDRRRYSTGTSDIVASGLRVHATDRDTGDNAR